MTRWITYSVIRLGIFTAIFLILLSVSIEWWISALLATAMAFAISYIFFYRQRAELAKDLQSRLAKSKAVDRDSQLEDRALDSEGDSSTEGNSEKH
jgi:type II secretory pathway component PulF